MINNTDRQNLYRTVVERYSSEDEIERYRKRSVEGLRVWEQRIVDKYLQPGKVLVVGCGGGRESIALDTQGYDVTGIDIIPAHVDNARSEAAAQGSKAVFSLYDGTCIPFQDATFDGVTLWSQVLGNVPGKAGRMQLLQECGRVLKKDCMLIFSVHDHNKTMDNLTSGGYTWKTLENGEEGDLLVEHADGLYCYWHYFTEEETLAMCAESGYTVQELTTSGKLGVDWDNLIIGVCTTQ